MNPIRILIVEDEDLAIELYTRLLRDQELAAVQFEVRSCESLERMQEILAEDEFDAIVLDLTLIGSSDSVQTREFIEEHHDELPPIIVLTGSPDLEMRHRCITAGAEDYVLKTTAAKPMVLAERVYNAVLRRKRTALST